MGWLRFAFRNWAVYIAGVLIFGLVYKFASNQTWLSFGLVASSVIALILIAATADYFRPLRRQVFADSALVQRAKPTLPPLAQIDPKRPLLGVGKSGEYVDCIALIVITKRGSSPTGSLWIFTGNGQGEPIDAFRGASISDFKDELRSRNIWVLPQSKHTDVVADAQFGRIVVRRLLRSAAQD